MDAIRGARAAPGVAREAVRAAPGVARAHARAVRGLVRARVPAAPGVVPEAVPGVPGHATDAPGAVVLVQIIVVVLVKMVARDVLVVGVAVQTHVKAVARVRVTVTAVEIVLLTALAIAKADVAVIAPVAAIVVMDAKVAPAHSRQDLTAAVPDAHRRVRQVVVHVPDAMAQLQCMHINSFATCF